MSSARPRTAPANDLPRTDELRLRATGSNGTSDYAARFDEHATVGRLADALERLLEGTETHNRTLHRTTRGSRVFDRSAALRGLDLRSGDAVALVATTALHRRSTAMPMARLRVVSGPDVGHSFDLDRGESFIGRSRWCTVVLHDAMASRRHVRLQVTDIVEISDAGSTNGIEINGEPATGLHRLRDGDRFTLGDTTLVLDLLDEPQGAATGGGNRIGFNRPPRLARPMQSVSVALPAKPEPPATSSLPWIAALAPLVMGGVMFALTRNILGVLFMALSPVMVVGNHLENLRSQRRHMRE